MYIAECIREQILVIACSASSRLFQLLSDATPAVSANAKLAQADMQTTASKPPTTVYFEMTVKLCGTLHVKQSSMGHTYSPRHTYNAVSCKSTAHE